MRDQENHSLTATQPAAWNKGKLKRRLDSPAGSN
jgi:hypothetical protein